MWLRVAVLGVLMLLLGACAGGRSDKSRDAVTGPLDYAVEQYRRSASELDPADGYPRTTNPDGSWATTPPRGWTSGFYPGTLWYLYEYTESPEMLELAQRWTAGLEGQSQDTGSHDVGFQIMCSYGNGYRLTAEEGYRDVVLQAARSLASRYNPEVGATLSWSWSPNPPLWKFPVIVDNMMNLELLFWAAKNGGDPTFYDMAVQHALTTRQYHVREDGSTYHVVDFDPQTGEFIRGLTWQGYADESAWARGQAWGLYGFTMVYRETGDERFLETAVKLADFFIENLPDDHVPYWDFRAPNIPNEERDASAGSIAASGLLELSTLVRSDASQRRYREAAEKLIEELGSERYLTQGTESAAVLTHCVGNRPGNSEVDVPIIYGDYYFVEALLRLRDLE
jgi:unsaturated chondroitin disaccharide hydrolase